MSNDILADIDDLILQATTERSHYYTAGVLQRAKAEIEHLRSIKAWAEAHPNVKRRPFSNQFADAIQADQVKEIDRLTALVIEERKAARR